MFFDTLRPRLAAQRGDEALDAEAVVVRQRARDHDGLARQDAGAAGRHVLGELDARRPAAWRRAPGPRGCGSIGGCSPPAPGRSPRRRPAPPRSRRAARRCSGTPGPAAAPSARRRWGCSGRPSSRPRPRDLLASMPSSRFSADFSPTRSSVSSFSSVRSYRSATSLTSPRRPASAHIDSPRPAMSMRSRLANDSMPALELLGAGLGGRCRGSRWPFSLSFVGAPHTGHLAGKTNGSSVPVAGLGQDALDVGDDLAALDDDDAVADADVLLLHLGGVVQRDVLHRRAARAAPGRAWRRASARRTCRR